MKARGLLILLLSMNSINAYAQGTICESVIVMWVEFEKPDVSFCNSDKCPKKGRVKYQYTIEKSGATSNITITESHPNNMRDQAVIDAIEKWRFEPIAKPVRCESEWSYSLQ